MRGAISWICCAVFISAVLFFLLSIFRIREWIINSIPLPLRSAIAAGYLVKWMNAKIQLPAYLLAFKTTFLLPILSAVFVMLAMYYVITPFGGWVNAGIRVMLQAAGDKGVLMYAVGISATTAIDLGGPINKAAGFIAFSFTSDHVLPITARAIAIVIPPIGLGLATLIDHRLTGRRLFSTLTNPHKSEEHRGFSLRIQLAAK